MKIILKALVILVGLIIGYEVVHLLWLRDVEGWAILSWMEAAAEDGPSTKAKPEDVGQFRKVMAFEGEKSVPWIDYLTLGSLAATITAAWILWGRKRAPLRVDRWQKVFGVGLVTFIGVFSFGLSGVLSVHREMTADAWADFSGQLQVGDVIAYRKEKWSARRELLAEGKLTVIGYRLFKYGHLAIVVEDWPNPDLLKEEIGDRNEVLYGLFIGTPLLDRPFDHAGDLPAVIYLYQGPLEEDLPDPAELAREVEITLVHEIAHFMGFDEEVLKKYGYD